MRDRPSALTGRVSFTCRYDRCGAGHQARGVRILPRSGHPSRLGRMHGAVHGQRRPIRLALHSPG